MNGSSAYTMLQDQCKIEPVTSSNEVTLVSSYVCSNSPTISAVIEIKAQFIYIFKINV